MMNEAVNKIKQELKYISGDNFEIMCELIGSKQFKFSVCDKKDDKMTAVHMFNIKDSRKLAKSVLSSCSNDEMIKLIERRVFKRMRCEYLCLKTFEGVNSVLGNIFDKEIEPKFVVGLDGVISLSLYDNRLKKIVLKDVFLNKCESNLFTDKILCDNGPSYYIATVVYLLKPLGFDVPPNITKKTKSKNFKLSRESIEHYINNAAAVNGVIDGVNAVMSKFCLAGSEIRANFKGMNKMEVIYIDRFCSESPKRYDVSKGCLKNVVDVFLSVGVNDVRFEKAIIDYILKPNNIKYKKSMVSGKITNIENSLNAVANKRLKSEDVRLEFEVDCFDSINVFVYNVENSNLEQKISLDGVSSKFLTIFMDSEMNIKATNENIEKLMMLFVSRNDVLSSYICCFSHKNSFSDIASRLNEKVKESKMPENFGIKFKLVNKNKLMAEISNESFGIIEKEEMPVSIVDMEAFLEFSELYFDDTAFAKFIKKYVLKPKKIDGVFENTEIDYKLKSYTDKILKKAGSLVIKMRVNGQFAIYKYNENKEKYTSLYSSLNKKDSTTLLNKLDENDESKIVLYLYKLLETIVPSAACRLLDGEMGVDKKISIAARAKLKSHIERIEELYIKPIKYAVDTYGCDYFCSVWKKYIISMKDWNPDWKDVMEDFSFLKKYNEINQTREGFNIKLESLTGSISFNKNTSEDNLVLLVNTEIVSKIKNTKDIIEEIAPRIRYIPFIEDYISEKKIEYLEKIELIGGLRDEYDLSFDESIYKIHVGIDLIDGGVSVGDKWFGFTDESEGVFIENITEIKKQIDIVIEEIYQFDKKRLADEFKVVNWVLSQEHILDITGLVDELPKKGISTYVSILSGDKANKVYENDYDKLSFYGKLGGLKKSYIEEVFTRYVDAGYLVEKTYKASFGRYNGYTLSKKFEYIKKKADTLKVINNLKEEEKICNLKALFEKMTVCKSPILLKEAILNYKENHLDINKDELSILIDFIKNRRFVYRECEDEFIDLIHSVVPSQFSKLFLLNSVSTSGVVQKTFKAIYNAFEN